MNRIYIGIDPGSDGYMCVMTESGLDFLSFKDENHYRIADTLKSASEQGAVTVVIEHVASRPGQGVKSMFTFGYNYGMIIGMLVALGIRYVTVPPQEWQKCIWTSADKVYVTEVREGSGKKVRKTDPKPTSVRAAQRLFPTVDLRRTDKCTTLHEGKCDALLICEYGRRNNL